MSESKIDIFDKCTTIKNRIYINYRTFAPYNKTIPEEVESFARKKEYILDFTWTLLDKASKKVILRNLTQLSGFILFFPLPSPCLAMSQTGVLEAILCP